MAALLAAVPLLACGRGESPRPDVLVVTLDTTRADHLGAYGYERPTSPNLDALAAESIVYDNAYSTSSWTLPAHASLFTGKYPTSHGVRHDPEGALVLASAIRVPEGIRARGLAAEEVTLAEALSRAGYATGAVVAGPWLLRVFGFDAGFDHYDDSGIVNNAGRTAESVTDAALDWLASHEGEERPPFFLFLNYFDPHAPYWPPPVYRRTFLPPGVEPNVHGQRQAIDLYDAEILYMDRQLGRLLDGLRESGAYRDTLIVVTADHGELFGDHGDWGHERYLWQELVRIPLIVKLPGGARPAQRISVPAQLVDVFPLVLDLAGVAAPDGIQGGVPPTDRPVLAEVHPIDPGSGTGSWRAQWDGDTKFMWNTLGERYLFDLGRDPGERENLVERQPELARRAEARLHETFAGLPPPPSDGAGSVAIDEATQKALRELGYLGDPP